MTFTSSSRLESSRTPASTANRPWTVADSLPICIVHTTPRTGPVDHCMHWTVHYNACVRVLTQHYPVRVPNDEQHVRYALPSDLGYRGAVSVYAVRGARSA